MEYTKKTLMTHFKALELINLALKIKPLFKARRVVNELAERVATTQLFQKPGLVRPKGEVHARRSSAGSLLVLRRVGVREESEW